MSIRFQNPASPLMDAIVDFHNDVQFYLIVILIFVGWFLFSIVLTFGFSQIVDKSLQENVAASNALQSRERVLISRSITHYTSIEIIWTTIPVFVLIAIAIPSFSLLFALDYQPRLPGLTVKIIGHQWYWSYELANYTGRKGKTVSVAFDSYMVPESDLEFGRPRLLTVDRQLILPANTNIRLLVTSTDVIHSWAVPAFGVKIDCIPGRLNQASLFLTREGTFYGQCSELCGVNHGFMPIEVTVISPKEWMSFFHTYSQKSSYDLFARVDAVRENGDKIPLLRQTNPWPPFYFDHSPDVFPKFMRRMWLMEYLRRGLYGRWQLWLKKFEWVYVLYPHRYFFGQADYLDFDNDLTAQEKEGSWLKESREPDFDLAMWIYRDNMRNWMSKSYLDTVKPFLYINFTKLEYAKAGYGYFPYYYGTNKILNWDFAKFVEKHEEQINYHAILGQKYLPGSHSIAPLLAMREPHRLTPDEEVLAKSSMLSGNAQYDTFLFPFKIGVQLYVSLTQTGSDKPGLKPATTIQSTGSIFDEIVRSSIQDIIDAEAAAEAAKLKAIADAMKPSMPMMFPPIGPLEKINSGAPIANNIEMLNNGNIIVTPLNAGQMLKAATETLENINGVSLKKQNGLSVFFYEVMLGKCTTLQVWLVTEGDKIVGAYKRLYDFRTARATLETCKREGIGSTVQTYTFGTPTHRTHLGEAIKIEEIAWATDVAKTALFYTVAVGGLVIAVASYLG